MKKLTKGLLACAFTGAMILTGCSSIAPVENKSEEILYQGGSVVSVGDYLFYANGFASGVDSYSDTSDSEYNTAKEYAYLSRVKKSDYKGELYSNDNAIDKISDRIAGYSNSYMFVYGDYIYYATPNMHKTNENKYIWTYVSVMRCKLDGSDSKEVYTTSAYTADSAEIKAIKYNGKAYLMIYDGTNLTKIALGKSIDKAPVVFEGVTSVAMPDEGEDFNGCIYYTTARSSTVGQTGNILYKVNIETNTTIQLEKENSKTITLVDRVENNIFYTLTTDNENYGTVTYVINVKNEEGFLSSLKKKAFYSAAIENVQRISKGNSLYEGFVFSTTLNDNEQIMYYNAYTNKKKLFITGDEGYSDTIVIDGDDFYYSTSDGIARKSTIDSTYTAEIIASGYTFTAGYFGYDYTYINGENAGLSSIYFYGEEMVESEDEEGDGNYYMYGVSLNGKKSVTLYGKTI